MIMQHLTHMYSIKVVINQNISINLDKFVHSTKNLIKLSLKMKLYNQINTSLHTMCIWVYQMHLCQILKWINTAIWFLPREFNLQLLHLDLQKSKLFTNSEDYLPLLCKLTRSNSGVVEVQYLFHIAASVFLFYPDSIQRICSRPTSVCYFYGLCLFDFA